MKRGIDIEESNNKKTEVEKLDSIVKEPEKIEYIIANCAECEPYITADYRRMLETPEELVGGMEVVLKRVLRVHIGLQH